MDLSSRTNRTSLLYSVLLFAGDLPLLPPEGCEELVRLDHVNVDPLIEEPITRLVLDTKAAIPLQADFRIRTSSVAHYTYGSGGMFPLNSSLEEMCLYLDHVQHDPETYSTTTTVRKLLLLQAG